MNEKMIEKLTTKGFTRWTKGKYDRLYINAKELGLVCEYYKTGNIHSAEFRGEGISNSEAYRMKSAKTYIDIATEEVNSKNSTLEEAAKEILEEVKAEIEAEEAAAKAEEETLENEWAKDAEYIVGVAEYKDEVGYPADYKTLGAKDIESAKDEAEAHAKEVFKYVGFWGIRVYRKTKHAVRFVNGKIETFRSVAELEDGGNWTRTFSKTIKRTILDNGNKWFSER